MYYNMFVSSIARKTAQVGPIVLMILTKLQVQSGGNGSYAVRMCHVDYALPGLYVLPTTSYSCALSAFGARTASGINPYRIGRFSRGPVPNASKRQFGSANLGSPGPLYGKATQSSQSESCLGGWRCKDPSEEVDRRRRGWTASRKISRPLARSRARAKDGSGSHSELLSRMDGTG